MEIVSGLAILAAAAALAAWHMPDVLMCLEALLHARRMAIRAHAATYTARLKELQGQ